MNVVFNAPDNATVSLQAKVDDQTRKFSKPYLFSLFLDIYFSHTWYTKECMRGVRTDLLRKDGGEQGQGCGVGMWEGTQQTEGYVHIHMYTIKV